MAACLGALVAASAMAQTADRDAAAQTAPADAAAPAEAPDFSVLADPLPDIPPRTKPAPGAPPPAAIIGSRNEKADGSVTVSAGRRLPTAWDTKVGIDVAAPAALPDTLPGTAQERGAGWANVTLPAAPIGLDKASIDARLDPAADQGRLSTSLSRSVPVGNGVSLTLQNGYSVTQTLANPAAPNAGTAPTHVFAGDGALRLELPSATAVSAGASLSSADDRLLPKVSAEQKLFGTPLSITGSISERPTGDTDRRITAGFKHSW